MPDFKPKTYKMEEGRLRQQEEVKLEKRRTFARFGIRTHCRKREYEEAQVKRYFSLKLVSERLGISGVVDMALISPDEAIPVDFKDGSFSVGEVVALHHKYQLLAYGLLLEEVYGVKAERGFIHSLEDGTTKTVYFSDGARTYLIGKIRKIRDMVRNETMPEGTPYMVRCRECEFKPICMG